MRLKNTLSLLFSIFTISSIYFAGPEPSSIAKYSIFDAVKEYGPNYRHKAQLKKRIKELVLHTDATTERNKEGKTALHVAAEHNRPEAAQLLLRKWESYELREHLYFTNKPDVNATDERGNTPLHTAAEQGHSKFVLLLLGHGAHVDAQNIYGITPLLTSAQKKRRSVISLLIEHGASINAQDEDGATLLHHAVAMRDRELVEFLLAKRVDILEDNNGKTPYSYALERVRGLNRRREENILCALLVYGIPMTAKEMRGITHPRVSTDTELAWIMTIDGKRAELRRHLNNGTESSVLPTVLIELIVDCAATPKLS